MTFTELNNVHEAGVKTPLLHVRQYKPKTLPKIPIILSTYKETESTTACAIASGVCKITVLRILKDNGVYIEKSHSERIKEMHKNGIYDNMDKSRYSDPEYRKKISENNRKAWAEGKYDNKDKSFYKNTAYQEKRAKSISRYMQNGGIEKSEIPLDEKLMVSLYKELGSSQKVADKMKVSKGCILRRLKKCGITPKNRFMRTDVPVDKVIEEYYSTSITYLARKYKCDYAVIKRILLEHNIELLSHSEATANCTPRGKEHPLYTEEKKTCRGANWEEQRMKCLIRDNFTCQKCGKTNEDITLDVHHIKYYHTFKGDWKLANELSNLVVYCKSCHYLYHKPWLFCKHGKVSEPNLIFKYPRW